MNQTGYTKSKKDLLVKELDFIKSELKYDHLTGHFTWREWRPGRCSSLSAGGVCPKGYISITVNGTAYRGHRLAWAIFHGNCDFGEIDHINGVKSDNRISNLRLSSRSQNCCNRRTRTDNKSGHKGVSWSKWRGKWQAKVISGGKDVLREYFDDIEMAKSAVRIARDIHHGDFSNHR